MGTQAGADSLAAMVPGALCGPSPIACRLTVPLPGSEAEKGETELAASCGSTRGRWPGKRLQDDLAQSTSPAHGHCLY